MFNYNVTLTVTRLGKNRFTQLFQAHIKSCNFLSHVFSPPYHTCQILSSTHWGKWAPYHNHQQQSCWVRLPSQTCEKRGMQKGCVGS